MDLKGFDLEHWWKMLAGFGAVMAVAAVTVKLIPIFFIGSGLFLIGLGEWINHPYREGMVPGYKISGHPRVNHLSGWLLDLIGFALAVFGMAKLLQSENLLNL
ncbi:hypothetical protein AUC71_03095 [Methyloceanibacter marginalis]|uniref:Uncharacterized protein n=1 Tax=Methyloceanibacter marginalis TaxID=1774971 RepID=A0A1E3W6Y2_9HYPH|nr:hypothetical protein [Methyloceanibacter marginalis]ODS01541.1 hypothetical protein AUC71_03095 [Methyloceanibacter marginalis]